MKIVIDIDEEYYSILKKSKEYIDEVGRVLQDSVLYGTPLPKGHGRLIDGDRLKSMYSINRANFNTVVGIQKWVDDAPTILEADKEG